jgi:hypothetical protein
MDASTAAVAVAVVGGAFSTLGLWLDQRKTKAAVAGNGKGDVGVMGGKTLDILHDMQKDVKDILKWQLDHVELHHRDN